MKDKINKIQIVVNNCQEEKSVEQLYIMHSDYYGTSKPFKKYSEAWEFYQINRDHLTLEELK